MLHGFRRACLLLAVLSAAALPVFTPARGQGEAPAVGRTRDVLLCGPSLLLPTDTALPRKLDAARDYARAARWEETVQVLQGLLDVPEDVFLPAAERWVGARGEAERLLGELPAAGREVYESTYGPRARARLDAAKGEPGPLADVARAFLHTRAGAEAAARLGALHLDRGRFGLAAAYLDRALRSAVPPDALTQARAALARRAAGHDDRAEATGRRPADEVRVGDRTISLADWEKQCRRDAVPFLADWLLFGGDETRSAQASGGEFDPEPRWQKAAAEESTTRAWLDEAVRRCDGTARDPYRAPETLQPALPAFFPLAVEGKVVARDHRGVVALDAATGETLWRAPSSWGLDALLAEPERHAHVGSWVESYLTTHPHALLDNSLLGSLASDGTRVFAVEDLPVPPYPTGYAAFAARVTLGGEFPSAPELTDALHHNRLLALDLATGRVAWEAGGRGDTFFLGPPLPLAGRLYAPVQTGHDLALVCLDPADGRTLWKQTLAAFKAPLARDGGRRLRAVHLAHGDGVLVCPTHAGAVVAFDLAAHRLAWAHAYREVPPPPPPDPFVGRRMRPAAFRPLLVSEPPHLKGEWRESAPAVVGGRVVLAPSDAADLLCLDLRDGSPLWKLGRHESGAVGDLYLAGVHEGKAVVVGRGGAAALDLADGKRLWGRETAEPLGRGVAASGVYYLPVRAGAGRGKVVGLDLGRGTVLSRAGVEGRESLGNLVFHRGVLLSQTATALTAFAPADEDSGGDAEARRSDGHDESAKGRPEALVAGLGAETFAAREAAARALDALGAAALPALRRAAEGDDPEVSRRARDLVRRVERRLDADKLLEPTRLRLSYRDVRLEDVAADLAKRTGMPIKVVGRRVASREVTVETGEVTFWEALDRVGAAAGVTEEAPTPQRPPPDSGVTTTSMMIVRGGARPAVDVMRPQREERPAELVLADGRPLLTYYAGAARVRALPPGTEIPGQPPPGTGLPGQPREPGEVLVVLDVTTEGRVQWHRAVGLRLDRATDEEGRPLTPLVSSFKPALGSRSGVLVNGVPLDPTADEPGPAGRLVPVRLRPGDKPPKSLKELAGRVVGQARTQPEALVTVEHVLDAAGRAVIKGERGGALRVVEVEKGDSGGVRLRVMVEAPPRGLTEARPLPFTGRVVVNGRVTDVGEDLLSAPNFALLDGKGKAFRVTRALCTGRRDGAAREYDLTYEPESGQGAAARFVYSDRRTVFLEVPFVLKDVPLP